MPKKLIEINKFTGGVVSTPSATDTDEQSAKYSSNIDSQTAEGRLQGIDEDKILKTTGFSSGTTGMTLSNVKNMVSVPDRKLKDTINLVVGRSASTTIDSIQYVDIVQDIYNSTTVSKTVLANDLASGIGDHTMLASEDKVHLGMGGSESGTSKVVMRPVGKNISGGTDDELGIFDSELIPPSVQTFSGMFSEMMMFPIHGVSANTPPLSYDDDNSTPAEKIFADYDMTLDNSSDIAETLWTAIKDGGELDGLLVGQIFKISNTGTSNDFQDNALEQWKEYDYNKNVSGVTAHDLFMYCGDTSEGAPILRFIGNCDTQKPSFAYAIKDDSSSLYKISLAAVADATAFGVGNITIAKSAASGDTVTIARQTTRITSISLMDIESFEGIDISAFSACSSPPLYNSLGLADDGQDPHTTSSNIYYKNGYLKILYRHSVFYIASRNSRSTLYRLNAIDFYSLTSNAIQLDDLSLDFTRIPDQLHAEDGKGIVRRTIEDQLLEPPEDPKQYTGWSNIPANAEIIGICETFDCGDISGVVSATSSPVGEEFSAYTGFYFTTINQSRLTTGDVVRFAGMKRDGDGYGGAADNEAFNVAAPYTVSVTDDGYNFWVDSGSGSKVPEQSINPLRYSKWWSAKVWILYGKKSSENSFNNWDLFLYNANTLDMTSGRAIYMADRTPPYHQARYYETSEKGNSNETAKLWYPGEFAFIKRDPTPGFEGTGDEEDYSGQGLQVGDVQVPRLSVEGDDGDDSGNYCEFGIYDKAGRWACNGVQRQEVDDGEDYNRPTDWVGGQNGPTAWETTDNHVRDGQVRGSLIWGNNIGWSIDDERQVRPTGNSLHPLVPYSSLYNGNMFYTGYNSTDYNSLNFSSSGILGADDTALHAYNNRPKHSVTFLGKVTGVFVVQPGLMIRNDTSVWDNEQCNSAQHMDTPFEIKGDGYERLKNYNNEYTLFTIDDFSGHRGSVLYEDGDDSISLTNQIVDDDTRRESKGGIALARPNWGGPEIEPPMYRGTHHEQDGRQVGSHSSVNGGYSAANDDANDKGWDGYTPPYLFNPGSGYYVYINRSWQGMVNFHKYIHIQDHELHTTVWGFQALEHINTAPDGVSYNRWNNFSSTALADKVQNRPRGEWDNFNTNNNLPFGYGDESSKLYTRFHIRGIGLDNEAKSVFNAMPSDMQSVCTMHKLSISDMGEINSVFPLIFNTNTLTSVNTDVDFTCGYLCATDRSDTNGSGALVLRTNFDSLWHSKARSTILADDEDYMGQIYHNRLFTNHTALSDYGASDEVYSIQQRGTHFAEIINISSDATNYTANSDSINGFQMLQGNLDTYNDIITGSNLVLAEFKPLKGHTVTGTLGTGDYDWWIHSDARDNSNVYFGYRNNAWTRDDGSTYSEDLNGNFFTADSEQLFPSDLSDVFTTLTSFITFGTSVEGSAGTLSEGIYYYKLAYEYDNQYESTLTKNSASKTLTPSDANNAYEYISVNLSIPEDIISSLEPRITGIVLYRKYEGGDDDEYSRIKVIKLSDDWIYDSTNSSYNKIVYDKGVLDGSYSINNGIDELIENTSLNYGISAVFQGYLFVSRAWHPELDDIQHYIFRSQPENFFAFDWTKDFVIMPERIIAMVSFNSRLYAWGNNTLYKIDPYSMLIEDSYEGFSILSKNSFVKTEFGLCFMDANNVYLHDGNKPVAIADQILHSSNDSVVYESVASGTSGYIKLEQGYRELAQQTLTNGYMPHISYSGLKDSLLIHLSNSALQGKVFSYNIRRARWDFWDSPKPYAITSSNDSNVLIADGNYVWNYLELKSDEWTDYNRREWDWYSKNINFNTDTQDKIFRSIRLAGTPSIYNYVAETVQEYGDTTYYGDELITTASARQFIGSSGDGGTGTDIWDDTDSDWSIGGGFATYDGDGDGGDLILNETYPIITNGKTYNLKFEIFSGDAKITFKNGAGNRIYIAEATYPEGENNIEFTSTTSSTGLVISAANDSGLFAIDAISVKEKLTLTDNITTSVQAYVDDEFVALTVKNKFYEELNLGGTHVKDTIDASVTEMTITTQISPLNSSGGISSQVNEGNQSFIRPGHLIKVQSEIMLVTSITDNTSYSTLGIIRGVMGTTAAIHNGRIDNLVSIVSPVLKFSAGTKGKSLSIRLVKQKGYVDSIGIVYKPRSIK